MVEGYLNSFSATDILYSSGQGGRAAPGGSEPVSSGDVLVESSGLTQDVQSTDPWMGVDVHVHGQGRTC